MTEVKQHLPSEADSLRLGEALAQALSDTGGVIFLEGELGAGKTTIARSLVQALGHPGRVVSPTYTLMEPYALGERTLYHLDLYRLGDAEELVYLGVRDIDVGQDLLLVEWPQRGRGALPPPDLTLQLQDADAGGRSLALHPGSALGHVWIDQTLGLYLDTRG